MSMMSFGVAATRGGFFAVRCRRQVFVVSSYPHASHSCIPQPILSAISILYRHHSSSNVKADDTTRSSSQTSQATTSNKSAASSQIPVNPSILNYIQYLDIGIPKKKPRLRKKQQQQQRQNRSSVLSKADEAEHFRSQKPKARSSPPPPPPFPSKSMVDNTKDEIIRYPVKILGKAGSSEEELPKPTKGLPEVVSWWFRDHCIDHFPLV
jgi:hypothetical protein